jgi:hypothetical protein
MRLGLPGLAALAMTLFAASVLAAAPFVVAVPDVDSDGVEDIASLVWDEGQQRFVLRMTDPLDGSTHSTAVLPGGLQAAGLAVATGPGADYVGALSSEPGSKPRLDVRNSADLSTAIRTTRFLNASWEPMGVISIDSDADGKEEFAVLGRNGSTGEIAVQIRAADTGAFVKNDFFFGAGWTPMQTLAIPAFGGPPGPEIGVLATHVSGQIAIMVKDASTNVFIGNVFFLNSNWQPIEAAVLPDFNGGGSPELALLAVEKNTGRLVVMIKDAATNAFLNNVFPLSSNWSPTALAVLPDFNANGAAEVVVLGASLGSGKLVAQVRDAQSGVFLENLEPLGSNWTPTDMALIDDLGGGTPGLVVGAFRTSDSIPAVQVLHAETGSEVSSTVLLGSLPPNAAPTAVAGFDQILDAEQFVQLDGTASSDPDGDLLAYSWSLQRPVGSTATLTDKASPTPGFTPDVVGQYVATLVVNDGLAASSPDSVTITALQPPVEIRGQVTFDKVPHLSNGGLNYAGTFAAPARGVLVELVRDGGSVLLSSSTDPSGNYSFSLMPVDGVFVRVKAQMFESGAPSWNFLVVDNTVSGALYTLAGSVFDTGTDDIVVDFHAPSGWDEGSASYTGTRSAAPFAILDAVYEAVDLMLDPAPAQAFPPLTLNWSPLNRESAEFNPGLGEIVTTAYNFDPGVEAMYILGDADADTDEYDSHVIVHEFAHYLEFRLGRSDSPGGAHSTTARLDPRLAFSEGWANAFSAMVLGDTVYKDSNGTDQAFGFTFNVENNVVSNPGWYNESSIHSVLYDIFDVSSDGVDSTSAGFLPIYTGMFGWHADSEALTSIFTLIPDLKSFIPSDASNIDQLLAAQSVEAGTMDIWASTETNDAGKGNEVLPVYTNVTIDEQTPVEVCTINDFGTFNRLSNRRFLTFDIADADQYRITVTGPAGSDPDLFLFRQGLVNSSEGFVEAQEVLTQPLTPGRHVVEVYDACIVFGPTANPTVCPNNVPSTTCVGVKVERL